MKRLFAVLCACEPNGDTNGDKRMDVPPEARSIKIFMLPPMSGLVTEEPLIQQGRIDVLMGEGRTAEVLRNLCYNVFDNNKEHWNEIVKTIKTFFGVELLDPQFDQSRGAVIMRYKPYPDKNKKTVLDLQSSGRGMQQVLLLLAHLYNHPRSVLLLDEPDAHLETLRQSETYQHINERARKQGGQIIAASHSEKLLEDAAKGNSVVAFLGNTPHLLGKRRKAHIRAALRTIGSHHYYLAEQKGWVLYLESETDLKILRAFCTKNYDILLKSILSLFL